MNEQSLALILEKFKEGSITIDEASLLIRNLGNSNFYYYPYSPLPLEPYYKETFPSYTVTCTL